MLNKKKLFVFFMFLSIFCGAYYLWVVIALQKRAENQAVPKAKRLFCQAENSIQQNPLSDTSNLGNPKNNIISKIKNGHLNQNSYINRQLGFSFPYPITWYKNGEDAEVINRNGIKTEVDINFADSVSQTSLSVIYHLPPGGIEFYNDIAKQYRSGSGRFVSGGSQLQIAGKNAFQSVATVTRDGKGHLLNPPFKLIFVVLPDYEQAGAIELQFKTLDLNSKVQMELFSQLLSGFMFIHK